MSDSVLKKRTREEWMAEIKATDVQTQHWMDNFLRNLLRNDDGASDKDLLADFAADFSSCKKLQEIATSVGIVEFYHRGTTAVPVPLALFQEFVESGECWCGRNCNGTDTEQGPLSELYSSSDSWSSGEEVVDASAERENIDNKK